MTTTRLLAALIPVSALATAGALALASSGDSTMATIMGVAAYVSTLATGLVMGAR